MGAWNDFVLSVDTLKGLSPIDWPASKGQTDVDVNLVNQARQQVEDLVGARIAQVVAAAGGTEAFFDRAAAEAKLSTSLQRLLGLAYLFQDWSDIGSRPGTGTGYTEKAKGLLGTKIDPGPLSVAEKAFSGIAPVLLGLTTEAVVPDRAVPAASFRAVETKPLTIGGKAAEPYSFEIR